MATRDDLSVRWDLSPRIITVAAPSVEITIQDLHDTLRDLEDEPANMIYPSIVSSAGKEPLGGGVTVGITTTLIDARLQFEGRPDPVIEGEIATLGSVNQTLVDDYATFISDGIEPGYIIENHTKDGYAEVVNVISETQLQTTIFSNGSTIDPGDQYNIWQVIQCRVDGGNLVAEDAIGGELDPIFPSPFTQVIRTSSSSATLQELEAIQYSSFGGQVHVNTSGTAGTTYPAGTPQQPVNNLEDALEIAVERGFTRLIFESDWTFESGDNVSLYELVGTAETKTTLTFNAGSVCAGSEFEDCTVEGTLVSPSAFRKCILNNITGATIGVVGTIEVSDCLFTGTITLSPALEGQIDLINCISGVAGTATPTFDMNGANVDVIVRNYAGGMEIHNFSNVSNNVMSIDMNSGNVILDSSCTTGSITVRGTSLLTDNTNGTTVNTSGLVFPDAIQLSSFNSFVYLDTVNGTAGTKYPQGTANNPVQTLADAKTIAAARNINNILLSGTLILGPTDNIDGLLFKGITAATSIIVMTSGCSTDGSQFEDLTITGACDGDFIARRCGIVGVTNIGDTSLGTTFSNCAFLTSVSPCLQMRNDIDHGTTNLLIRDCSSLASSGDGPVLDFNNSNQNMVINNNSGDFIVRNVNQGNNAHLTLAGGHWTFENTCTDGTFEIDGIGVVVDLGVGSGFTFVDSALQNPEAGANALLDKATSENTTAGSRGEQLNRVDANTKLIPGTL